MRGTRESVHVTPLAPVKRIPVWLGFIRGLGKGCNIKVCVVRVGGMGIGNEM